jgi:hypothetical protein
MLKTATTFNAAGVNASLIGLHGNAAAPTATNVYTVSDIVSKAMDYANSQGILNRRGEGAAIANPRPQGRFEPDLWYSGQMHRIDSVISSLNQTKNAHCP